MVLVLRDVGEVRKETESANDLERLRRRQAVQRGFEFAPRPGILVTVKTDRVLADALDRVEHH